MIITEGMVKRQIEVAMTQVVMSSQGITNGQGDKIDEWTLNNVKDTRKYEKIENNIEI